MLQPVGGLCFLLVHYVKEIVPNSSKYLKMNPKLKSLVITKNIDANSLHLKVPCRKFKRKLVPVPYSFHSIHRVGFQNCCVAGRSQSRAHLSGSFSSLKLLSTLGPPRNIVSTQNKQRRSCRPLPSALSSAQMRSTKKLRKNSFT